MIVFVANRCDVLLFVSEATNRVLRNPLLNDYRPRAAERKMEEQCYYSVSALPGYFCTGPRHFVCCGDGGAKREVNGRNAAHQHLFGLSGSFPKSIWAVSTPVMVC